jgi:hypothetical protein
MTTMSELSWPMLIRCYLFVKGEKYRKVRFKVDSLCRNRSDALGLDEGEAETYVYLHHDLNRFNQQLRRCATARAATAQGGILRATCGTNNLRRDEPA